MGYVCDVDRDDEKPRIGSDDTFSKFGLSQETANVLGSCNFSEGGVFEKSLHETKLIVNISPSFHELKMKTCNDGHRQFQDRWTDVMNTMIQSANRHCVWKFTGHYIKGKRSRKNSVFFRCNAKCKIVGCFCSVFVSIINEGDTTATVHIKGDISHKIGETAARQKKRNCQTRDI